MGYGRGADRPPLLPAPPLGSALQPQADAPPSIIVERVDDGPTGTYLLLRLLPHGYRGKAAEIGTKRSDAPKELVGKI